MSLFEMAKIPMEKASKLINLDPNAEAVISQPERTLEVSIPVKWMMAMWKYSPAIVPRTAPCLGLPKAAFGTIRMCPWMK